MAQAQATERKTFYSRSAGLTISINPQGSTFDKEGKLIKYNGKLVSFSPAGSKYGVLTTNDPDAIEYIERQLAEGNPDYLTPEDFVRESTPADVRANQMETELSKAHRIIEEQNALLTKLREQGRLPK